MLDKRDEIKIIIDDEKKEREKKKEKKKNEIKKREQSIVLIHRWREKRTRNFCMVSGYKYFDMQWLNGSPG